MATWEAGTNDSASRGKVAFDMYVVQDDYANNRSLVRVAIGVFDNNGSYGGYGTGSWSIGLNGGQVNSGSVYYDFSGGGPGWIWSGDYWVGHNADGSRWVDGWASFGGTSPVGSATASGGFWLTDFAYPPGQPGAPTLTRNSTGTSIGITSQVPGSAVGITAYQYVYSTDNANWSGVQGMSGNTATFAAPSATTGYYIMTRAGSNEGWGAWSPSAFIAGVPTAPASINATRTARNVAVTCTAPSSDGGSAVTGYFVQYSTDGGSTWSTAQAMSSQSYTYTNLTAALTYTFRVYATNSIGSSATTASNPLFVPAGGKRWDGSAWVSTTTAKRWDGTAWVDLSTAKRWDGTAWVDLS